MEWDKIIQHDVTKPFPLDECCIDVCITSPPYWGLRDYGVDGQIGLESHPQEYIDKLVLICREIRRVLKKTGSFYLNLGDTFYGSAQGYGASKKSKTGFQDVTRGFYAASKQKPPMLNKWPDKWLQPKQLMLMPARVAIALQDDGWILRNLIIWHKKNSMPTSVKDRLATTYELVFYFVKNRRYYYDLDAIRVPHAQSGIERCKHPVSDWKTNEGDASWCQTKENPGRHVIDLNPLGKNPGDVLEYNSKYKKGTHGQTPQGFTRVQSIAKERTQSREDAKRLYPNDPKKQQEYINYIHDHGGDPRGRNPGDVVTAKYKGQDINPSEGHIRRGKELHDGFPPGYNGHPLGKNPGDFWEINTQPFTGYNPDLEHFAVFPESLVLNPLKASCPKEICKKCGKTRIRIVERKTTYESGSGRSGNRPKGKYIDKEGTGIIGKNLRMGPTSHVKTLGWTDCGCNAGFDAGVVLDPFCGRGTVGKVAKQLGLHYILFDIKPEYCELARLYIGGQKHKLHRDQSKLGVINEI